MRTKSSKLVFLSETLAKRRRVDSVRIMLGFKHGFVVENRGRGEVSSFLGRGS